MAEIEEIIMKLLINWIIIIVKLMRKENRYQYFYQWEQKKIF